MYVYSFEKLEVWQLSSELVEKIYKLTAKFPREEKFGMVSQMRRSAVSVASNIAEGAGRFSSKNKIQFYNIGYSSLMELLNQVIISYHLNWLLEADYIDLRVSLEKVSMKLNALENATKNLNQ